MSRQARQASPQAVFIVVDNSGSMRGAKAKAATKGIREMLMCCQSKGPHGRDRSYFKLMLIRFGDRAEVVENCNMTPVRHIDPQFVDVSGNGGGTNLTAALELTCDALIRYQDDFEARPNRADHPLPLVVLFSDGRNGYGRPASVIEHLKSLRFDGEPVPIAVAGVALKENDKLDEELLRQLASPQCYVPISRLGALREFIANVGSSAATSSGELARVISQSIEPHPSKAETDPGRITGARNSL